LTHQISKKWFKDEGVAPNYVNNNIQWEILDGVMNDRYSSGLMLTGLYENLSLILRNKLHVIKISDASVAGLLLAVPIFELVNIKSLQKTMLNFEEIQSTLLKSTMLPTKEGLNRLRISIELYYSDVVKEFEKGVSKL